jgi:hypothetical protein
MHGRAHTTSGKLSWSQYVEILPVEDAKTRRKIDRRAETEQLSSRQLREIVRASTSHAFGRYLADIFCPAYPPTLDI